MSESAPVRLAAPVLTDEDAEVTMAQGRSRPAWAEIDLAAVAHNASVLARLAAPAELCAVVKAHGYGHGGPAVARAALAGGARRLAVALVDEGVELREHGVTAPILLLSECDPAAAATALSYGLTPTLYSAEGIAAFGAAAAAAGRPVAVHVKVDTGMHRVGAPPEDLHAIAAAVVADPLLQLEGIWTHLPVADGDTADRAYTEGQLDLFDRLVAELAAAGISAPLLHAANTAGAIAFARARHDIVRCGLGLYGYLPGRPVQHAFDAQAGGERLRPAMALKARVVAVRTLAAGERPSYGRRRPLPARSIVATVPIGYADGVPRALFDGGYEVLIGGVRRPLAGAVTMDQIVVDCGDDDSVRPGDEVVLLGRQGDEVITADDWAALLGTISYEVVCGVGPRMPRVVINRADVTGAYVDALERLRTTTSTCTLCPLAKGRTQVVFGVGAPTADLLFVGEGPGREEDLAGEPFVGRSGKLLDRLMWEEVGLTRAECYIANVVKCRPPQNRDPAPKEIEACRPYLAEQIALIDPRVIVTLGNFATKLLLETTKGIRELRGQVFDRGRASLVPTYHPAYVLRAGGEAMAEMRADFVRAKRLMAAARP